MNISINKESVLQALQKVVGAYEKNHSHPSLANVLINISKNQLKFICTNLEIEITTLTQLTNLSENADFSVSVSKFYDIFRLLPDEEIFLNYEKEKDLLIIQGKHSKFSLKTLSTNLFPAFESAEKQHALTIKSADLIVLIKQTSICIANKDFRVFLNGLLFHVKPDELICVSSDSHRLGLAKKSVEADFEKKVIIPRRSIIEILKIIQLEESEVISINFFSLFLEIQLQDTLLKTKLIVGEFPDYKNLIPLDHQIQLIANKTELQQAVKTIAVVLEDKKNTLILEIYENILIIKNHQLSSDEEKSEIRITLEQNYPNFKIAFNARYLLEILREITGEKIKFNFTKPTESCLIYPSDDSFYQYVVMPMNI